MAWQAGGHASADAFCAATYPGQSATCSDVSSNWQTDDGRSIFCPNDGSVDDGGCDHTVFCCTCGGEGELCDDSDACNVGAFEPGRRLLEHLEDGDTDNDDTSTHIELGSTHLHMGITGHGQIHLDNTLMFEGDNTILHVRHRPPSFPYRAREHTA